jgi:hypothetical protein
VCKYTQVQSHALAGERGRDIRRERVQEIKRGKDWEMGSTG